MKEQFEKHSQNVQSYIQSLKDIRVLGLFVFVVILLLITWSGIKVVDRNYELQKQINELSQQAEVMKLQNETLKLGNEYYNTDTYLELAARQHFGLANPGETEVLISKQVALGKLVPEEKTVSDQVAGQQETTSKSHKNLQAWLNFFLHREQVVSGQD